MKKTINKTIEVPTYIIGCDKCGLAFDRGNLTGTIKLVEYGEKQKRFYRTKTVGNLCKKCGWEILGRR